MNKVKFSIKHFFKEIFKINTVDSRHRNDAKISGKRLSISTLSAHALTTPRYRPSFYNVQIYKQKRISRYICIFFRSLGVTVQRLPHNKPNVSKKFKINHIKIRVSDIQSSIHHKRAMCLILSIILLRTVLYAKKRI